MNLDDLPPALRLRIRGFGFSNPEVWIHQPKPALGDASIVEILQQEGGEAKVRDFLDRIEHGFPTGYD